MAPHLPRIRRPDLARALEFMTAGCPAPCAASPTSPAHVRRSARCSAARRDNGDDIDGKVRARISRQVILDGSNPPDLRVLLEESVLTRRIGSRKPWRAKRLPLAQVEPQRRQRRRLRRGLDRADDGGVQSSGDLMRRADADAGKAGFDAEAAAGSQAEYSAAPVPGSSRPAHVSPQLGTPPAVTVLAVWAYRARTRSRTWPSSAGVVMASCFRVAGLVTAGCSRSGRRWRPGPGAGPCSTPTRRACPGPPARRRAAPSCDG
jgi:Domain of unknown function (DUF5753)